MTLKNLSAVALAGVGMLAQGPLATAQPVSAQSTPQARSAPVPVVTAVPVMAAVVVPVAPVVMTPVPMAPVVPARELHHRGGRRGLGGHRDRKGRRAGGRARQTADQRGQEDQDRPGSHRLSPVVAPG